MIERLRRIEEETASNCLDGFEKQIVNSKNNNTKYHQTLVIPMPSYCATVMKKDFPQRVSSMVSIEPMSTIYATRHVAVRC